MGGLRVREERMSSDHSRVDRTVHILSHVFSTDLTGKWRMALFAKARGYMGLGVLMPKGLRKSFYVILIRSKGDKEGNGRGMEKGEDI